MRTKEATNTSEKVIDAIIASKSLNKEYSAPQILKDLDTHRNIYHLNNERLPSEAKVYQILRNNKSEIEARQDVINSNSIDLDRDWNLGSLSELGPTYYLSPESLTHILLVLDFSKRYLKLPFNEPYPPLTIRQAIWIARLYPIISQRNRIKNPQKDLPQLCKKLWDWSEAYATHERISKAFSPPFDTTELDQALLEGATPVVASVEGAEIPSVLIFHPSPDNRVSMIKQKQDGE